jgi:hypothetical protein
MFADATHDARGEAAVRPPTRKDNAMNARARPEVVTSAKEAPASSDLLDARAKGLALALLALTQFVVVLDASIVNVALPSIGRALHFSQGNLSWVVNA